MFICHPAFVEKGFKAGEISLYRHFNNNWNKLDTSVKIQAVTNMTLADEIYNNLNRFLDNVSEQLYVLTGDLYGPVADVAGTAIILAFVLVIGYMYYHTLHHNVKRKIISHHRKHKITVGQPHESVEVRSEKTVEARVRRARKPVVNRRAPRKKHTGAPHGKAHTKIDYDISAPQKTVIRAIGTAGGKRKTRKPQTSRSKRT